MPGKGSMKAKLIAGNGPLSRVPPVAVFLLVAALFAGGVLIGGLVGAVLLGVLAAGMAVLLATTWPVLSSSQRVLRALVLAVLIAVAVSVLLKK